MLVLSARGSESLRSVMEVLQIRYKCPLEPLLARDHESKKEKQAIDRRVTEVRWRLYDSDLIDGDQNC